MEILVDVLGTFFTFTPEMIGTALDREQPTTVRVLAGIGGGLGVSALIGTFVLLGYVFSRIGA
jgi:hypothetical protein